MIAVTCTSEGALAQALLAEGAMGAYRFYARVPALRPETPRLVLHYTPRELAAPYIARASGVKVSTHLAEALARYGGVPVLNYLRLVALAGLARARALQRNPALGPHDLLEACHPQCVFAARVSLEECFEMMEGPLLCLRCRVFYGQLLSVGELAPVQDALERMALTAGALRA